MTTEQKIKQSIIITSRKISSEVAENLNMTIDSDALDLITEMAYKKISLWGEDLEAFQKHAKRAQINTDDVKLLVRKNESLKELVEKKAAILAENQPVPVEAPKRKRKNTSSTS